MSRWLVPVLSLLALAAPARANWFFGTMDPYPGYGHPSFYFPPAMAAFYAGYGYDSLLPGCAPVYPQPCTVTCYRPEWRAEQVPCTTYQVSYREEQRTQQCTVLVPRWFDEQRTFCYTVPVPRVVQSRVLTWSWTPVISMDPWTCCCRVCWVPQACWQTVATTVCDYQTQTTTATVKVCRSVPEVRTFQQRYCVPVVTPVQTTTTRWHCTYVPYQVTLSAPCP